MPSLPDEGDWLVVTFDERDPMEVHVVHRDERDAHESSRECWCLPSVTQESPDAGFVVSHDRRVV